MPTAAAIDYRTPLLALRAAVRAAKERPDPGTLGKLSAAVLALPSEEFGPLVEDGYLSALRTVERAQESQLFPRIEHMECAVLDMSGVPANWTPAYAADATAVVVRLLAACHEWQTDMEEHPYSPWSRAAEAGTRLLRVILCRTDARPAGAALKRAAVEFAARLRSAVAHTAVMCAARLAEAVAWKYGLFPISPREPRGNGGRVDYYRRFGANIYRFELVEPGVFPDAPHGRVTVVRSGDPTNCRSFPLTARTSRAALDRFADSL